MIQDRISTAASGATRNSRAAERSRDMVRDQAAPCRVDLASVDCRITALFERIVVFATRNSR